MSKPKTESQSPALHAADRHDVIRVQGARENNSHQIVSISSASAITTKMATLRIWKSTDDHSRATPR